MRQEMFAKFQASIKAEKLNEEQMKALHSAIQGYFRDWFVRTNQYKQISEMVMMMEQELP